MRVAAVDIGTNSMRLIVTDGITETGRWERITSLGEGVDRTGRLANAAIGRTLEALAEYRDIISSSGVARTRAIATSASRDASNREEFFEAVEGILGVRPELISGDEEARLAYAGAATGSSETGPVLVSDIGGGSTEFVTGDRGVSVDIGSVRITERAVPSRPAPDREVVAARSLVRELFTGLEFPSPGTLIGVAGTWTELPKLARRLPRETDTHGMKVSRADVADVVGLLAGLTVEETAALPYLNPKRALPILGGVIVAEGVMDVLGVGEASVSIRDTLDGVASALLAEGLA